MRVNIPMNGTDVVILIILAVILAFAVRVIIGFFQKPKRPDAPQDEDERFHAGSKIELTVDGMQCGMCEMHVKDAIREAIPDAKGLTANHTRGKADFVIQESMTRGDLNKKLHETIDPSGYRLMGLEALN